MSARPTPEHLAVIRQYQSTAPDRSDIPLLLAEVDALTVELVTLRAQAQDMVWVAARDRAAAIARAEAAEKDRDVWKKEAQTAGEAWSLRVIKDQRLEAERDRYRAALEWIAGTICQVCNGTGIDPRDPGGLMRCHICDGATIENGPLTIEGAAWRAKRALLNMPDGIAAAVDAAWAERQKGPKP